MTDSARYEELQAELASLRDEVGRLRTYVEVPGKQGTRLLSRRNLLRSAPVAAIGGAMSALAASPARADDTGLPPIRIGIDNHTDNNGDTTIESPFIVQAPVTVGTFSVVPLYMDDGNTPAASITGGTIGEHPVGQNGLVISTMDGGTGLFILSRDGVVWNSVDVIPATGIEAHVETGVGLRTTSTSGVGAEISCDTGTGVGAGTQSGVALNATCNDGQAFTASSGSPTTAKDAVTVDYQGTSRAMYVQSHNPTNINGTITGVNEGRGIGVWGEQRNDTGTGFGVVGVGGALGRGAQFSGGAAPVRLVPSVAATHPTTGKAGDLFVDSSTRLWFCRKRSTGTTEAVWKQLA